MASSFDGIGLGSMGFERQFMTGDNPLREALKGAKTGLILKGLEASGIRSSLNPATESASATGAAVPPQVNQPEALDASVPPPTQIFAPSPSATPDLGNELNKEWGLESSSTFTTPNTMQPSPSAMDTSMLQIASMPAPRPGKDNLPQYGNKQGGGVNPIDVISKLAAFFI